MSHLVPLIIAATTMLGACRHHDATQVASDEATAPEALPIIVGGSVEIITVPNFVRYTFKLPIGSDVTTEGISPEFQPRVVLEQSRTSAASLKLVVYEYPEYSPTSHLKPKLQYYELAKQRLRATSWRPTKDLGLEAGFEVRPVIELLDRFRQEMPKAKSFWDRFRVVDALIWDDGLALRRAVGIEPSRVFGFEPRDYELFQRLASGPLTLAATSPVAKVLRTRRLDAHGFLDMILDSNRRDEIKGKAALETKNKLKAMEKLDPDVDIRTDTLQELIDKIPQVERKK